MKYRLYIDEVGNPDFGSSINPNHRYLSLTGIILELDYVATTVFPAVEALKRDYFGSHPDEPIILHRKELVNKRAPFANLRNPEIEQAFNESLFDLLKSLDYTVITVTIDKLEYNQRYQAWRFDPYHHCLTIMVEKYVSWLQSKSEVGSVMAESRGGKEDRLLKEAFERLCITGTAFIEAATFSKHLTSGQLKVKPNGSNIAGLQLADPIAHPSFRIALARKESLSLPDNFGSRIGKLLEVSKYLRSPDGQIDGWGREWLP